MPFKHRHHILTYILLLHTFTSGKKEEENAVTHDETNFLKQALDP